MGNESLSYSTPIQFLKPSSQMAGRPEKIELILYLYRNQPMDIQTI